jgi:uncharacterized membrane protein YebE (DUF533 family)
LLVKKLTLDYRTMTKPKKSQERYSKFMANKQGEHTMFKRLILTISLVLIFVPFLNMMPAKASTKAIAITGVALAGTALGVGAYNWYQNKKDKKLEASRRQPPPRYRQTAHRAYKHR